MIDTILNELSKLGVEDRQAYHQQYESGLSSLEDKNVLIDIVAARSASLLSIKPTAWSSINDHGDKIGLKGLIDGGNYWINRTPSSLQRYSTAGFTLSSDIGISSGGTNGTILNLAESFSRSYNTWSSKTSFVTARYNLRGLSLTCDTGLVAYGFTGSVSALNDLFTNSTNSWTSKTAAGVAKQAPSSISLTSDLGVFSTGSTGSFVGTTDSYSISANIWVSKTAITPVRYSGESASFTTSVGILSCGYNGFYIPGNTDTYNINTNTWTSRTAQTFASEGQSAFSFTSDQCMFSGGYNLSAVLRIANQYSNSMNLWLARSPNGNAKSATSSFSNYSTCGIISGGWESSVCYGYTSEYQGGSLGVEYASAGFAIDSYFLSPVAGSGIWTNRSVLNATRQGAGSFGLTPNTALLFEGKNGSYSTTSELLTESSNSWTNKTGSGYTRQGVGSNISSSIGICQGGQNANYSASSATYDTSGESWTNRTDGNTIGIHTAGKIGTNYCLFSGGGNTLNAVTSVLREWNHGSLGWTVKTNAGITRRGHRCYSPHTWGFLISGGYNTGGYEAHTEYYNFNSNSWVYKTNNVHDVYLSSGLTIRENFLSCCGYNGSGSILFSAEYNYNFDSFIMRTPTIRTRQSPTQNISVGYSNTLGYVGGGWDGSSIYYDTTERYDTTNSIYCPIPADKSCSVSTIRLRNQFTPINNVFASALVTKTKDTPEPTYNVSVDDGNTWSENYTVGKVANIKNLKPSLVEDGYPNRDLGGVWISRIDFPVSRSYAFGYEFDNFRGIVSGGTNGSGSDTASYIFNDFSNTTQSTGVLGEGKSSAATMKITSDLGVAVGGTNNSGFTTPTNYMYTVSTGLWTSKTDISPRTNYPAPIPQSTSTCLVAGGDNNSSPSDAATRYNHPGNTWTARTAMSKTWQTPGGGCSFTTDLGFVAGGQNGGGVIANMFNWSHRFSEAGNAWGYRNNLPIVRTTGLLLSLGTDTAVQVTGQNPLGSSGIDFVDPSAYKHTNSTNTWNRQQDYPGSGIYGRSHMGKIPVVAAGVSNHIIKYSDLYTPKYQLKVKFNLNRDPNADVWTSTTEIISGRCYIGSFSFTTDCGVITGGESSHYVISVNDIIGYYDSSKIWSLKTIYDTTRRRDGSPSATFNSDLGLVAGGRNGAGVYIALCDIYSLNMNIWRSVSNLASARGTGRGFSLTSDTGLVIGGYTGTVANGVFSYTLSSNTWTTKSAGISPAVYDQFGFTYSSDTAMNASGANGSMVPECNRYSLSYDSFTSRTVFPNPQMGWESGSSTTNSGFTLAGSTVSVNTFQNFMSNDSANIWIAKTGAYASHYLSGALSLSSSNFICAAGTKDGGTTSHTTCSKYTSGETNFLGFAITDFNGANLI